MSCGKEKFCRFDGVFLVLSVISALVAVWKFMNYFMFSTISLGALGALFLVGALLLVVSFVFTFSILSAIRDELLPWLPGQLHWWFKLIPAERELLRLKVKFAKIDRKKRPPSAMQVLKAKAQQVLEEFCTEQRRLAKEELKQMDDTETARLDDRLKGVIGVEAFDQIK